MEKINKWIVLAIISIGLTLSLSACGSNDEESANTLKIVYQAPDEAFESWMNNVADQFKKEHEDIKVKLTAIESSEGDYPNKKILMMKSDSTAPDIIMEDSNNIHADSAAGYLEPLTDAVNKWDGWDHFFSNVKEGMKGKNDDIYGIPITTDVRGLWYNKKQFKKVGINVPWEPKTWDDVVNAAKKLKDHVEVPMWMSSAKSMGEGTTMQTFLMLLYGTDGKLYNADKDKWILKSDGFLDSLKFIDDIYSQDLGASMSWGITGQAGAKVSTELMPKGEVGIALDGSWMSSNWTEAGNVPWPEWEENIDIAPMPTENGQEPGKITVSGGWTLAVPAKASHKDLAVEFIELATSKKNLRYANALTPRKDIAELDEYQQIPLQTKITNFLEYTHYRPTYDAYPKVSSKIQAAVESVATGAKTPKEAMDKYAEDVKRSVGKDNTIK